MAGLGSEGAGEDEEDTTESLRLEGTKHQYKLCGKLEVTAYLQSSADGLLRSDHAGCDVEVVIKFDCRRVGLRSTFKGQSHMQLSVFTWIVLLKFH